MKLVRKTVKMSFIKCPFCHAMTTNFNVLLRPTQPKRCGSHASGKPQIQRARIVKTVSKTNFIEVVVALPSRALTFHLEAAKRFPFPQHYQHLMRHWCYFNQLWFFCSSSYGSLFSFTVKLILFNGFKIWTKSVL